MVNVKVIGRLDATLTCAIYHQFQPDSFQEFLAFFGSNTVDSNAVFLSACCASGPRVGRINARDVQKYTCMPSSSDARYLKTVRGRQEYGEFLNSVNAKRTKLEDPMAPDGTELLNEFFTQLDQLFDQNISGKANTSLINLDQSAFKEIAEITTERLKNQARCFPGEITAETFVGAVAGLMPDSTRSEVLSKIGLWFNRASNAVSLPAFMPMLSDVNPSTNRAPSGPRGSRPSGPPEEAGSADGTEFQTHKLQKKLQGLILDTVSDFETSHEYEPVQLHRLCFDKASFVNTLENLFVTGTLLRTQLLWLGASDGMLPVVGTVENRARYLQKFIPADGGEPTGYSGPHFRAQLAPEAGKTTGLRQFNLNLTYELFEELQRCYGSKETLVDRNLLDTYNIADNTSEDSGEEN